MKSTFSISLLLIITHFTYCQNDCPTDEYSIGDTWNYETVTYINEDLQVIDFQEISIIDTLTLGGNLTYQLSNADRFYSETDKMYFWDEGLAEYILYYDFNALEDYSIKYYDQFRSDTFYAEVVIDSSYESTISGFPIKTMDIKVYNSGSHPDGWEGTIYNQIGINFDGPKIDLDCGLCDPTTFIKNIRCFSNFDCTLNFQNYSCDSTFSITSTDDFLIDEVIIYPNPASDRLLIESNTRLSAIEIYDIAGQKIITTHNLDEIDISQLPIGAYFIKIHSEDSFKNIKFVKN